jgi:hypothetical protein
VRVGCTRPWSSPGRSATLSTTASGSAPAPGWGAVALAAADQHRRRADRVATTDVGGQVVADHQRALAGGVLQQPHPPAGVQVLAVVAARNPVDLGGDQLRLGPQSPERGVQVVVGGSVAGIGDQDVGGSLARPGQAVGEGGRGDRVCVGGEPHREALGAQPPHRLGGAGHDLAAHVQRAVQVQQQHGVDAG